MNADEVVRAKGERLIELVNNPYCTGPLSLLDGVKEFVPSVLSLIESLQAQIAKYDEVAAEYGIDGKTMLTLAKSQIKTAQDNIKLREQLAASRRRAQDARNELCLKCGRYHEAHNGACDGCRWKE